MFWVGFTSVFKILMKGVLGLVDFYILVFFTITTLYLYDKIKKEFAKKPNTDKGLLYKKNVYVTGGSSGIGKCVAILAAKHGANVTIIARNLQKMQFAHEEISNARRHKDEQKVECVALDVGADYDRVYARFFELQRQNGPCYMLINCAGTAICGQIEKTTEFTVNYLTRLNFLGTYYCTKAVISSMKKAQEGKIVIVSSQAALLGIYGYSAYCASKFALRGLAETLSMELKPYNISITLSLPPDTDTPGFAEEERSKPLETKLISESAGLTKPEVVAEKIMKDALDGKFFSIVGLESYILTTLCSGMSPHDSLWELVLQALFMGPLRIASAFIHYSFDNIVRRCKKMREEGKELDKPENCDYTVEESTGDTTTEKSTQDTTTEKSTEDTTKKRSTKVTITKKSTKDTTTEKSPEVTATEKSTKDTTTEKSTECCSDKTSGCCQENSSDCCSK